LKGSQNGREHEEEEVSSYWITLRKREWNLKDCALSCTLWRTCFFIKMISKECMLLSLTTLWLKIEKKGGTNRKSNALQFLLEWLPFLLERQAGHRSWA